MFHKYFKEKYEFMTKYFENAFMNTLHSLPHSIILYGSDSLAQYIFALNLSKILNCKEGGKFECNCLNCRWVRENKHPAILTYTKNNNKPSDDESTTVISIAQIKMIRDMLANTSQYHRVFIFCDEETKQISNVQKKNLDFFSQTGFALPSTEKNELWYPLPLKRNVLPEVTSNALLKSIEEPPKNVTFIFLTSSKNDLLQTIVSRSQAFHIAGFCDENYNDQQIETLLQKYPVFSYEETLDVAEKLIEYLKSNLLKPEYVLCAMQNYLQKLIIKNKHNKLLCRKIIADIFLVKEAQLQISSNIKEQNVFESLLLKIAINN